MDSTRRPLTALRPRVLAASGLMIVAIAALFLLGSAGGGRASAGIVPTATPEATAGVQGDVDCDLDVDSVDGLKDLRHVAGLTVSQTEPCPDIGTKVPGLATPWGDVDCDGDVDSVDGLKIERSVAALSVAQTEPCVDIGSPLVPPKGELPPLTVAVDSAIVVPADIPGVDGKGPPRPLAVVQDEDGNKTVFVADELVIVTSDMNALNDFLDRWQATLVKTLDPSAYGIDMPQIHLVRLNPAGADTSHLQDDLRMVNANAWGDFGVSSQDAAELLALAAGEAAGGMQVDLNWVMQGSTFDQRDVREAATGPGGWNPNPFTWSYMNRGSPQDTGVADSWRALAAADKLGNKVKVSILDGGFVPNDDFPAGYIVHGSTGVPNPATCTGGSACPWHGTMVTAAAMGVPDNGYGVAGPAGPIAQAIITQSPSSDILSYLEYIFVNLPLTALEGPDVINISAGSGIASEWCLTGICSAMDGIMVGVRDLGMLVFAAAGNDNTNVDQQKCIDLLLGSICYEKTIWIPCEVDDVICVGGLADNSTMKHSGSNYGTDSSSTVDIFGPYVQYQTPNPDSGIKHGTCGTSCATPFVAGVAALIKAADPNLGAGDIEQILMSTAHTNSGDPKVPRWVNAYAAVITALGNEPPELHIEFSNGTAYGGIPLEMRADVRDPEDLPLGYPYKGVPAVQWTDSVDGSLGSGIDLQNVMLSYGQHTITATATDSQGSHISDVRTLNVVNVSPTVHIVSPPSGSTFYQGQIVHLVATSADLNYPSGHLPDSALTWYLTPAASPDDRSNPIGNGHDLNVTMVTQGDYAIVLVGTDDQAATGTDVATDIHVGPPPADLPPTAVIDSIDDSIICGPVTYEVVLNGHATDNEDGALSGSSLVWTINGSTVLGTGTTLHVPTSQIPVGDNTVTLTATDSNSGTGSDIAAYHFDGCIS